ncbi:MAG: hypothetical protein OEZ43_13820 [Gammaproteobacteria bacterium]|nr:hypothetical protein [Gammaproteobacteria bacterium]
MSRELTLAFATLGAFIVLSSCGGSRCSNGVAECGKVSDTASYSHTAITLNNSFSPTLLHLAAPATAPLQAPWDARDRGLMRIAAARTPDSDIAKGVVLETTTPCEGGGTLTDTQNNEPPPWYSQGDSYITTYSACVTGDTQVDGTRSYIVDVLTGQPYVDVSWSTGTTIARDIRRTDLISGQVSYAKGSMSELMAVVDGVQYTQILAGSSDRNWFNNGQEQIGIEAYEVTYAWDETTQLFEWDFKVQSNGPVTGESAAETVQTLRGTLGQPPESGQFRSAKTSSGVTSVSTITAIGGGNVLVETDSDGDGIVDNTTETTWRLLLLDSPLNQFI